MNKDFHFWIENIWKQIESYFGPFCMIHFHFSWFRIIRSSQQEIFFLPFFIPQHEHYMWPNMPVRNQLLRCETVKIWKIHGKLKYSESWYCFANISATEARIFMKFYVGVNFYLVNLSLKFHKDPCIDTRARVVNARAYVISRMRTFTFTFLHGSL